jgi:hypothetical protein
VYQDIHLEALDRLAVVQLLDGGYELAPYARGALQKTCGGVFRFILESL